MYTYSFAGRSRRSAVTCAILALVAISVAVPSGAFPSTGKIIDLRTKKHYILSMDGTFSLTSGEAVESGTLNAPKTVFTRVPLGKSSTWIGKGIGRVTNLLTLGTGCQLDGAIILSMFGSGPVPKVPASTIPDNEESDLEPLHAIPSVPAGYVGVSVTGAAVSGMKTKTCTFDGVPPQTVTMAGLAATSALALANEGALIFPSAGGIIKRSSVGNPSYTFTYQLKSA